MNYKVKKLDIIDIIVKGKFSEIQNYRIYNLESGWSGHWITIREWS